MLSNRIKISLLLVSVLFILLPYIWAFQFIFPASDDWGDYMFFLQHGTIGSVKEIYYGWSGRYISTFLVFWLHPAEDLSWIKIRVLCFLAFLLFLAGIYLCARIAEYKLKLNNHFFLLFSWILLLVMGSLPSTSEFFFWFTGAYAYIPGFFLISLWLFAFYIIENTGIKYRILWFCSALIPGTNEYYIITAIFIFTICLFIEFHKNKHIFNPKLLFAIALFGIGAGIALLSPGSQIRQDFVQEEFSKNIHNLSLTFESTIQQAWFYLRDWMRSSPILLTVVGIAFLIPNEKYNQLMPTKRFSFFITIIPLALFVLLFAPYVWLTGYPVVPERVLNILFLWFCFAAVFGGILLLKKIIPNIQYNPHYSFLLFSIVFIHSTYSSNSRFLLNDMPAIQKYATQMQERIDFVLTSSHENVYVSALKNKPRTFVFSDLDENPNHWYNKDFSRRFNLKSIQTIPTNFNKNDSDSIRNHRE